MVRVLKQLNYNLYDWDINYPNLQDVIYVYTNTKDLTGIITGVLPELEKSINFLFKFTIFSDKIGHKTVYVIKKHKAWSIENKQEFIGQILYDKEVSLDEKYSFEETYALK